MVRTAYKLAGPFRVSYSVCGPTVTTFNALTTNAKHKDEAIQTTTDVLPGHWYRLTPKAPPSPGEYVMLSQPVRGEQFAVTVYPFGIDPKAPVSGEGVRPGGR